MKAVTIHDRNDGVYMLIDRIMRSVAITGSSEYYVLRRSLLNFFRRKQRQGWVKVMARDSTDELNHHLRCVYKQEDGGLSIGCKWFDPVAAAVIKAWALDSRKQRKAL